MSAPTVRTQFQHIDHWCSQWWSPTLEQEQDWRDIERRDFMSHDERLRPVERRTQEQLLFMIRDDLRRERKQERAMVASLRRSAVNGVYRMAAATGGNVVSGSLGKRHWAVDPLSSSSCPTLAQADTDSIPAAQGTPPGSPWDHMLYSQESDSPIVR